MTKDEYERFVALALEGVTEFHQLAREACNELARGFEPTERAEVCELDGPPSFWQFTDMLCDGDMPLHSVRVIEAIDDEGDEHLHVKVDGDVSITTTVGVLDRAKHSYLTEGEPK